MAKLPEATHPAAPPPTWSIPLDWLDPNPFQPRREMDEAALAELVAGIREHGLLQPITLRRQPGGRSQVIGGHRRLEAYRRLLAETPGNEAAEKYGSIPAHEKLNVSDEEMALFGLSRTSSATTCPRWTPPEDCSVSRKCTSSRPRRSPSCPGWNSVA